MGSSDSIGNPQAAPGPVRFLWGVALTPVAGTIGFFLGVAIYTHLLAASPPPSAYHYEPAPTPWVEEVLALVQIALFTSLFSWPVTLVVFPLVRGYFWRGTWKAFAAVALSGLVTGLFGPVPALLLLWLIRPQNGFALEWFFPTLGSICGLITAIPYFLLTNPRRPARPERAGGT